MSGFLTFLKWTARILAGIFVAFHVYALALIWLPVPGTVLMMQRAAGGETVRRDAVPLSRISPHLVRAVIAAEDTRFCGHDGIDMEAIEKALEERREGKGTRGASTITQQTAKNVFLWNGGGVPRKLGDMWMGVFIDQFWGKARVMEVYLNVAEWGDGLFGAEAAAQARFGKSAADLTEREAALLAAVLPSPNKWRVDPPGPYVSRRAGTLQARMRVVRSQGLAACVLGASEPQPAPSQPPQNQPAPEPEPLPDLPAAPETGPESDEISDQPADMVPERDAAGGDDFDTFLEGAQERFGEASDEPVVTDEEPEPLSPEAEAAQSEAMDGGPVELRPRDIEGEGLTEPEPDDDTPEF
ncbi:MAG: monofunctional biosynthetic peptidoglycan transglycosylase [Alphaproteobacteria bacterium]|nr:monofunctional biosynthetic peptidoglycan transglycosylase [Alphaproteobacteria bacterium]